MEHVNTPEYCLNCCACGMHVQAACACHGRVTFVDSFQEMLSVYIFAVYITVIWKVFVTCAQPVLACAESDCCRQFRFIHRSSLSPRFIAHGRAGVFMGIPL